MFFRKKTERAMNWLKEKNEKDKEDASSQTSDSPDYSIDNDSGERTETSVRDSEYEILEEEVSDKKLRKQKENVNGMDLEKHDLTAMLLAAFLIFTPVALLVLGLFALISWVFF